MASYGFALDFVRGADSRSKVNGIVSIFFF